MNTFFVNKNKYTPNLYNEVIVVYEPEIIMSQIYHKHLSDLGFEVFAFNDLGEDLEELAADIVVFSSWNSSYKDLLGRLKSKVDTKFVVFVSDDFPDQHEEIISLGITHLVKRDSHRPIHLSKLIKEICTKPQN